MYPNADVQEVAETLVRQIMSVLADTLEGIYLKGSLALGDFNPETSDVDLLVTFEDGFTPGLEFFGLADELEGILGRRVDLLTRPRVERDTNPYFKLSVLSAAELLYAA